MGAEDQVVQEVGDLRIELKGQKTYDNETREIQGRKGQCFIQVTYLELDNKEIIRVSETQACSASKTIRTGFIDEKGIWDKEHNKKIIPFPRSSDDPSSSLWIWSTSGMGSSIGREGWQVT